jgi:cytochrome c-type biogenesis protein CcmE
VRLVLALSVAAALAVFLLYTSIAGGGTPQLRPSQLAQRTGDVGLVGRVVKPVHGNAYGKDGMRFRVRDVNGDATVLVVYHGQVPDLFKAGRDVVLQGHLPLRNGVFVAKQDSLVTKCPSKYTPAPAAKS